MIIGYDGKRAVKNMTGLGNYSRLVVENMAKEFPASRLLLYTPEMRDNPRLASLQRLHNVEFRLPAAQGFHGTLWRTFGLTNNLAADKVELYHGLSNELPLNIRNAGLPSVVTIHDVIYRRLPYCYKPVDRMLYDFKYSRACRNATRIIAVSQRTKEDVMELYGIDADKIDVVYQGCDESFKTPLPSTLLEETRGRLQLPEKFILQVGTIERRKNLELTIRSLTAVDDTVSLVAVGKDNHGYLAEMKKLAESLGVSRRLKWIHDLQFSDMPAVCQLAEVIAYPSRYEGFGIPVIEGLESMRPVVAATGSCLEEAGGEAAFYVDPDDVRAMGATIRSILSAGASLQPRLELGKRHAATFNTADMAAKIMDTYHKAIEAFQINDNPGKQGCR